VVSPDPTDVPDPESESYLPDLGDVGEAVEAVAEAIGETFEAIGETFGETLEAVVNLGDDLSEEEREEVQAPIVSAIIVTQVAQAAVSMAIAARPTPPSAPTPTPSGGGGAPVGDAKSSGSTKRSRE
jgi:hypothetical protein